MAEALYRKYRPQIFEDVVGQEHIERTIKNAIAQDKVRARAAPARPPRRAFWPRRFCARRGPRLSPTAPATTAR